MITFAGIRTRVVGATIRYLHAPSEPEAVSQLLRLPDIKIVSLTITEGGYNFDESTAKFMLDSPDISHDLAGGIPRTAFGLIVRALERRRAAGVAPLAVVSCDRQTRLAKQSATRTTPGAIKQQPLRPRAVSGKRHRSFGATCEPCSQ
ncbi:hypothetical protein [Caballeronia sordidicola]|uniref:hypothetical protein n=1 Tax=Caballeronia sordidicola TaxID=196367 RepID=UPI00211A2813|nr:hypothetical protein [Caballeronia sordidicola]